MRQRKRHNITERDIKRQLIFKASNDHALTSDENLLKQWENLQNEIKKFYVEEYAPALIKNAELTTELNTLSISILNRNIFTAEQIKQSLQVLGKSLENCLGNNNA